MGAAFRSGIKVALVILISSHLSGAFAYQQPRQATPAGSHVSRVEAGLRSEKSGKALVEKPEKCYLALHLEMAGTPFAAQTTDAVSGVKCACEAESQKYDRNHREMGFN
ncbi:MAG: hypothetical protein V4568_17815 [Pseudomonadota bacterium]